MAATKISALSAATALAGTETLPVVQGGATVKATVTQVLAPAVIGPASATDNAVVRFDSTTGKLVQNSVVTVSDTGSISIPTAEGAPILKAGAQGNWIANFYASDIAAFSGEGLRLGSTKMLAWHATLDSTSYSLGLFMDASDTLAQRRGTNAQTYRLYNSFTDDSNYERFNLRWASNIVYLETAGAGTGSQRALAIDSDGLSFYKQGSLKITMSGISFGLASPGLLTLGHSGGSWGGLYLDYTNTATVGAVTINKPAGRVRIAAAGTSVVVTNSLVTAASKVFAVISTNDATAVLKNVVPAAGSFTINLNAAATAETTIDFFVVNAD